MQLIDLTIYSRNDNVLTTPALYGFDAEDIVVPIIVNENGKASFAARMMKGSVSQNYNLAKAIYEVQESLAVIANKSPLLVKLTVLKRRGVDVSSVEYVFVASRISENITPTISGGSRFFYNEDGDVLPVEYEVLEDIPTIIAATSVITPPVNPLTWAQAQAIRNAGLLNPVNGFTPGVFYHIIDAASPFVNQGIVIQAITETELSLSGDGIFLNPDYQGVGDYSGIPGFIAQQGVWRASMEASLVNGDVVIRFGLHFLVIDDTAFDGSSPQSNPAAYYQLPIDRYNGYILEVDLVTYDFNADTLLSRKDKRGNYIETQTAIDAFQWGNDNVLNNLVDTGAALHCTNNKGGISKNSLSNNADVYTEFDGGTLERCSFSVSTSINFILPNKSYVNKTISPGFSNFEEGLDFSDPSIWDSGTQALTIPTDFNYVGIFTIIDPDINDIKTIANSPVNHVFRFYCENGGSQSFHHEPIATAVADQLTSDTATVNAIVGRINGSDFIEYERSGNLNRRHNLVISA